MKGFLLALQFLTVIPVRIRDIHKNNMPLSLIYFPIIGLLIGIFLAGLNNLFLSIKLGQFASSIILVVLLIIITGGLHLDGLSDTTDAFLSRKSKEEMLRIMRDSTVGVMGVLSLISIILLKISLLFSIDTPLKTASLLLMCILSRWALVFSIALFPYARQEGKLKAFINEDNPRIAIIASVIALVCALLIWGFKGLFVFLVVALNAYLIGKFIMRKIDGITGDTLGAINELCEVIVLLTICILNGVAL